MSKVQELRSKIKNGEVKVVTGGNSGPKVGEGDFVCRVDEATFGKGENGNPRGMIRVVVIKSENEAEIGGKFNVYVQTTQEKYLEQSIAMWAQILVEAGVNEDKIYDDADDLQEVMQNIMTQVNKQVKKGFKLYINRKQQAQLDAQGRPRFYNNIRIDETIAENKIVATPKTDDELLDEALGADKPVTTEAPSAQKKKW